ncbi:MAG: PQQ-like beta-propeller repeat protein [Planctomycetaceae bacterium]|nr:PQQ-like beta-propeller repeat protein [Planctomycetaceae bacterium]
MKSECDAGAIVQFRYSFAKDRKTMLVDKKLMVIWNKVSGLLLTGVLLVLCGGCGSSDEMMFSEFKAESPVNVIPVKHSVLKPESDLVAPEWPCWRGVHRDGISREHLRSDALDNMPPVLWRHNIGIGYSAVSVAGGKVYALGHPEGTEQETAWCFDALTGKIVWSISYPCQLLDHLHKGGPGASPALDGQHVYINSREGEVRKLDAATGQELWKFDLRAELQIPLPEWGFTCTPVIRGEEVLLEAGSVVGLDKQTGQLKWKTAARMPGYGTPELFEQSGRQFLAALNNEGLSIVDLATHEETTFFPWDSPYDTNSTTPLWLNGQIFVSTGYNIGAVLLNFDGNKLEPVWQNKEMRNHMNSCVLHNGWLYGFDGNSHNRRTVTLKCVNWETGEVAWTQEGLGCGALMATAEHLIITSDLGELVLAEMTPKAYQETGRITVMNEQCWTMPILCDQMIYCRGAEGTLACVDLAPERTADRP